MTIRNRIIKLLYGSRLLQSLLFNPLVEYHQWRLNRFIRHAAASLMPEHRVIDIGAGELKYKKYFSHCTYVSNDLCVGDDEWDYANIDIVSPAHEVPVESNSFDAVLCIQVLEHLDAPARAMEEFHRLLRPGGRVYLSAPLIAGEHQQPFDFFRYTRFGLAFLADQAGLRVISIAPHGGSLIALETLLWSAFWGMLPVARQTLPRYLIYVLLYPLKIVTGLLALLLDVLDRKKDCTINYDVILHKPDA